MSKKGLQIETHDILLTGNKELIRRKFQNQDTNPYLSTSNYRSGKSVKDNRHRIGKFHKPGEIIQQTNVLREKLIEEERANLERAKLEQLQADELALKIKNGDLPDLTKGEDRYLTKSNTSSNNGGNVDESLVEWWDKPFLDQNGKIKNFNDEDKEDEEDEEDNNDQITLRYVLHPKLPQVVEPNVIPKLYLTNKERKKLRRNKREQERKEKELKIKIGLLPKPEPKVKLSNMMNVAENNHNINDPTQWEKTVKDQINARKMKHLQTNQERSEMAKQLRNEQSNEDSIKNTIENGTTDNSCKVYQFNKLINPSIRYKLNMNSKQLHLRGFCLRIGDNGPGIIIILGKNKFVRKMDKLIMNRLPWTENFIDKGKKSDSNGELINCENVRIVKKWEGFFNDENKFPDFWFMKRCSDEKEMVDILNKYSVEHFYSK